jgi:putative peptidoglycan lipid II flippase
MLSFLNKKSKSIIGAATIVGVLSFASRLVGLVRDRILAGEFGAGEVLDAYYAAFKVPDFMFSLIVVGSLSASFIPLFTKYYARKISQEKAWHFTNKILHVVGVLMVVVSVALGFGADFVVGLIAPGFSASQQEFVVELFRIMLGAQVILAFSVVFGSVLQSLKRFFLYALSPILYNVGIILGAVLLVPIMGPVGLAWGVVLGALMHLVVQTIGVLNAGYRYRFAWGLRDKDTLEMLKLTGPRMLGIAINQVMFVILTIIATTLATGSVTIFQFAYNIQFFPVGIIGVSFAIAAFPTFSEAVERKKMSEFIEMFSSTVRNILFLLVPLMILFLVMRAQIVRVVVGAGSFDWEATILTADTLAFFALTFIPQAFVFLLARAFFALHDTVTPMTAGIIATIVGLISALWLTGHFGVIGLGMGYSIAAIINMVLLWVPLRQRIGKLDGERILLAVFKISVAGMLCLVVMQLLKPVVVSFITLDTFFGVFLQGFVAGISGWGVYIGVAALLRTQELYSIIAGFRRKFFKSYKPEESVSVEGQLSS